jgi:hypothetical protein
VRARPIASVVLTVLASLCAIVALLAGYARTTVLDSDQFADRAVSALREDAVRDLVAAKITDEAVLRANRDLVSVRPLVQSAASAIVGTGAFQGLFRTAVRDLHRTVFTSDRDTATLVVADVGVLLRGALERLDPAIARQLPAGFDATLDGGASALESIDAAQVADGVQGLAWIFGVAAVVLLAAAILVATDRRRAVVRAGIGIAAAGAVVVIAYQVGRSQLLGRFGVPEESAAAGMVFDAYLQDLRTWALVMLGAGTIIAAASASLLRAVDVEGPLRRAWTVAVTVPATPRRRALRALVLMAAGVFIIVERAWLLDAALVLAGVYVLYQGVAELLRLIAESRPVRAPAPAGAGGPEAGEGPATRRRGAPGPLLAGGLAAALVVVLVVALVASGGTKASSTEEITACNGHAELCDRPVDAVAFAATHNAMSAQTYPSWLFAQQEQGLRAQLDAGVHALLIDGHYGERVGSNVRTDLDLREERAQLVDELGEPAVEAALRIRDRLVGGQAPAGPRSTWLCHGFCELGAIEMTAGLREVRDYLVANPNEVLIIVIQDEGVTPEDVDKAFAASGVRPFVYTGAVGRPWPTLREMIESGGRVIVMGENDAGGGGVPWYHDAFAVMQETPYHFTKSSEFSCAPNRGPAGASLLLINHWIDTSPAPRPSNAAKVNAYEPLLARVRKCQSERGLMPNVIAVDFFQTGDLMRVVDTLNRVPQAP